jgi:hypothetical protein
MVLMVEYGPEALGDGRRPRRKEEFDWLNWLERKTFDGLHCIETTPNSINDKRPCGVGYALP